MTVSIYAKDIMTPEVVTASPDMTCEEVQELLFMHKISGTPVVDERGVLVGVISLTDILQKDIELFVENTIDDEEQVDKLLERKGFHVEWLSEGFVSDYMTRNVKTALPDASAEELASILYNYKIHRIIIVEKNEQKPVGIVSTFDLLKVMASGDQKAKSPV